jgi:4-hydroxy-3-polyprenylbenzoate decarboxylase
MHPFRIPPMAIADLRGFIRALEKRGELVRVKAEADPRLEIGAIADRVMRERGKALLFERCAGSPYPLLINAFGSMERCAIGFGAKSVEDIAARLSKLLDMSAYGTWPDRIKALPRLAPYAFIFPRRVAAAPCREVIEEEPDIGTLPVLTCWPGDGGPFLTLPLVITRHPVTGVQNMGMYRMQVFDARTTGMHIHPHKDGKGILDAYRERGERMPVAVALGADPATIYAATAPLPEGMDELLLAGFIRKEGVPVVKSGAGGILVPANAEFILEGYVDPAEKPRAEGPFGDHTGYYSAVGDYPVFHLERITRRRRPIYPATIVGRPPKEDCYLAKVTERLFLPVLRLMIPEIVDVDLPLEGVFHDCAIVSIGKRYPGHARKAMNALWGLGQMMYQKMIVVVDADVSPHDYSQVAWRVFNNIDARRDLVVSEGPLDALDHSSPTPLFGARLGVDATRKLPEETGGRPWPDDMNVSAETAALIGRRWKEYGIG